MCINIPDFEDQRNAFPLLTRIRHFQRDGDIREGPDP
jgi:hypothetical protein